MNGGLLIIRGLQDNSVKNVDPVSLCGPGIGQIPSQISMELQRLRKNLDTHPH